MAAADPPSGRRRGPTRAWSIALSYALFAALWIYYSDQALTLLVQDPQQLIHWSVYKGWGFVALTSVLLFLLLRRALDELRDSLQHGVQLESSLADLLRYAPDAVIGVDEAQRVVQVNPAAEGLFGASAGQLTGRTLGELIGVERVALRETPLVLEGRTPFGTRVAVEISAARSLLPGSGVRVLMLRDVRLRLAQHAEIERLSRLYDALRSVNQAIAQAAERNQLLQQVCEVLVERGGFRLAWIGWYSPDTALLMPVACSGDGEDYIRSLVVHVDERAASRGPAWHAFVHDERYVANDVQADPLMAPWLDRAQRYGVGAAAALPIRLAGRAVGTLTVYAPSVGFFESHEIGLLNEATQDLALAIERLQIEEERNRARAVVESERLFSAAMIESMPGVVYFYDADGRFLRWNRNFEQVTGYSGAEISRMHPLDFFEGSERELLATRIEEVFRVGESSVEAHFISRDGSRTPYFFTGRTVRFEQMTCLVGVGIDISQRHRAEQALRELNERLERTVEERTAQLQVALRRAETADRLKSAFLASMSHELRTPLNSIIGFTGILLQRLAGPLNEEQARQLGMVRSSAHHLLDLINDVLDISRIEAGQLEVRHEHFDPLDSLNRVVELVRPLAVQRGLQVRVRLDDALPRLCTDRRRFEQILINLLNNAIKFTDHGSVTLDASRCVDEALGDCLRIDVIDTGQGIRHEDLEHLFQPFRQLDVGLDRSHEGTGLGLAICRRLADLLGGRLGVDSAWQQGSTFTLLLPIEVSQA